MRLIFIRRKVIGMNKIQDELELVFPTPEYKTQDEEYLQEFFDNGEYEIAGDGGLDRIKNFEEWLLKVQKDLSEESIEDNRIPATLYLTVRKSDNRVVGNLQIRHKLNEKLLKNLSSKVCRYRKFILGAI